MEKIEDEFAELLKTHYDGRLKEVGDRVCVWDSFACFNENGERIYVDESIIDHPMIVIDDNVSIFATINYQYIRHFVLLDVKLYNSFDKNIVFTSSEFCKILDP